MPLSAPPRRTRRSAAAMPVDPRGASAGFATGNAVMAEANAELLVHNVTLHGSASRSYQEAEERAGSGERQPQLRSGFAVRLSFAG